MNSNDTRRYAPEQDLALSILHACGEHWLSDVGLIVELSDDYGEKRIVYMAEELAKHGLLNLRENLRYERTSDGRLYYEFHIDDEATS